MSYSSRRERDHDYVPTGRARDEDRYDDDGGRSRSRHRSQDRIGHDESRYYDRSNVGRSREETYSTKAIQAEYAGSAAYPDQNAPEKNHRDAEVIRVNTRVDGNDERFRSDDDKRKKVSLDNHRNMNNAYKHGIHVEDTFYRKDDPKRYKSSHPGREHSWDPKDRKY